MAGARKRLDLKAAFAFRAGEGRRRKPRLMRMFAAGEGAPAQARDGVSVGPSGRPRKDPAWRRAAMFAAPSGRPRFDPYKAGRTAPGAIGAETAIATEEALPLRTIAAPDFVVFAVLETVDGPPSAADEEALAAARALADGAYEDSQGAVVAVCGPSAEGLDRAGADRVIRLPEIDGYRSEAIMAHAVAAMEAFRPRHILFPETQSMRDAASRLAALLGERPALGVHGFDGRASVRRGFGGAKDLKEPAPLVLTIAEGAARPVSGARFEARMLDTDWSGVARAGAIDDLGLESRAADEIALEEAPFILAAGAGLKDWEAFASVARRLNATRAGTRVVCDQGLMPRDRQVGASGRIVDAECYVALGISGAVQHLQGIESCDRVVAVNTDAAAPIMKRADLAIIGDANAILAALHKKLEAGGR